MRTAKIEMKFEVKKSSDLTKFKHPLENLKNDERSNLHFPKEQFMKLILILNEIEIYLT